MLYKRLYVWLLHLVVWGTLLFNFSLLKFGISLNTIIEYIPLFFYYGFLRYPILNAIPFVFLFVFYFKTPSKVLEGSYFYRHRIQWIKSECIIVFFFSIGSLFFSNETINKFFGKYVYLFLMISFILVFVFVYQTIASSIGFLIEAVREHKAKSNEKDGSPQRYP